MSRPAGKIRDEQANTEHRDVYICQGGFQLHLEVFIIPDIQDENNTWLKKTKTLWFYTVRRGRHFSFQTASFIKR